MKQTTSLKHAEQLLEGITLREATLIPRDSLHAEVVISYFSGPDMFILSFLMGKADALFLVSNLL